MPALIVAWRIAATLLAPALRLSLRLRAARGREIAARLPERRGIETMTRPRGRVLWLHAASVGETISVLPVIAALPPELTVLLTTGTVTSARLFAERLPMLAAACPVIHRFVPLDVPAWAARFLDHWQPDAAGFVESELWPNLIGAARQRGIRLALVNARLSGRSAARWGRAPRLAASLLGAFETVLAQGEADARRLAALGARDVACWGDLKFSATALPVNETDRAALAPCLAGRPVWLAASTHPGEEAIAAAIHERLAPAHPGLLTIIVPRHPERGPAIAAELGGVPRRALGEPPPAASGVWLADTLGELGLFYRMVKPVFMGKSLAGRGGQNPLEPARLGAAICVGPHTANFADAVAILREAGALAVVEDGAGLADWIGSMLADPSRASSMGEAGRAVATRFASLPGRVAAHLSHLAGL